MKDLSPLLLEQKVTNPKLDFTKTQQSTREILRKAFEAIQIPHAKAERAPVIAGEEALGLR